MANGSFGRVAATHHLSPFSRAITHYMHSPHTCNWELMCTSTPLVVPVYHHHSISPRRRDMCHEDQRQLHFISLPTSNLEHPPLAAVVRTLA